MPMILLLMIFFVSACDFNRRSSTPCEKNEFFCQDDDIQAKQITMVGDNTLVELSRVNYLYFHPPSHRYAEEVVRRGPRGVQILVSLNPTRKEDLRLFRDAARVFRVKRQMDLCQSGTTQSLQRLCQAAQE